MQNPRNQGDCEKGNTAAGSSDDTFNDHAGPAQVRLLSARRLMLVADSKKKCAARKSEPHTKYQILNLA